MFLDFFFSVSFQKDVNTIWYTYILLIVHRCGYFKKPVVFFKPWKKLRKWYQYYPPPLRAHTHLHTHLIHLKEIIHLGRIKIKILKATQQFLLLVKQKKKKKTELFLCFKEDVFQFVFHAIFTSEMFTKWVQKMCSLKAFSMF